MKKDCPNKPTKEQLKNEVCWLYQNGKCLQGDKCYRKHEDSGGGKEKASDSSGDNKGSVLSEAMKEFEQFREFKKRAVEEGKSASQQQTEAQVPEPWHIGVPDTGIIRGRQTVHTGTASQWTGHSKNGIWYSDSDESGSGSEIEEVED